MRSNGTGVLLLALFLTTSVSPAQTREELDRMYHRLEYDTRVFDGVKQQWEVTDQRTLREILLQFSNTSAVTSTSVSAVRDQIPTWTRAIDAGDAVVRCRKRWYDDEVELLVLTNRRSGMSATLDDYALIREILGERTYGLVKTYRPAHRFSSPQGRRHDLYMHLLNPEITVWSTIPATNPLSRAEYVGEWYALSMFGQFGNDALALPFWYRGTFAGGLRLTYFDNLADLPDRQYNRYSIAVGWEEPMNFSLQGERQGGLTSVFRERRAEGSGSAVYAQGTYTPRRRWNLLSASDREYLRFSAEFSVAFQEREVFSDRLPETFYSIRNSLTLSAEVRNAGLFHAGAGCSWHDLHHFSRVELPDNRSSRIEPASFHYVPFVQGGISHDGGLIQLELTTRIQYDLSGGFGHLVFSSAVMLSNTIGVDVRYYSGLNAPNLPPWHYRTYIAISPIVRINY